MNHWKELEKDTIEALWKNRTQYLKSYLNCTNCSHPEKICPCAKKDFIDRLTFEQLSLQRVLLDPNWQTTFKADIDYLKSRYYYYSKTIVPQDLINYWNEKRYEYKLNWKVFEARTVDNLWEDYQKSLGKISFGCFKCRTGVAADRCSCAKKYFVEKLTFHEMDLGRKLLDVNWRDIYKNDIEELNREKGCILKEYTSVSKSELIKYWIKKTLI
ncbi:MAG: hypothetical protein Hyperionvirus33_8 [Hyperionvirus sp.]|uniref:Uncharacterized protein n=1 Tax=Hyperionvirus sp. TaxID=2487770 RepID=A0A3G5ABS3_9VIRU|nr:MAG: hypothetical protein Hyperionvirus33_8 [Hyperionvirus sp.]